MCTFYITELSSSYRPHLFQNHKKGKKLYTEPPIFRNQHTISHNSNDDDGGLLYICIIVSGKQNRGVQLRT